jgi:hypothetical protein
MRNKSAIDRISAQAAVPAYENGWRSWAQDPFVVTKHQPSNG